MKKGETIRPDKLEGVLLVACPKCSAPAGEKCRNYKGGAKPICRARMELADAIEPPPEPPKQADLFPLVTETGQGL